MKRERALELLALFSFLGVLICYFLLPEKVPIHWNASGEIDLLGHKANVLWMGGMPVVLLSLFRVLPRLDPLRASYEKHAKALSVMQVFFTVFFIGMVWMTIAVCFGVPLKVGLLVRGGMGILFAGMGNFMGQLKRNFFIGVKTPWALNDDEVWRLTHRRAGWVFVLVGIFFLASVFVPDRLAAFGLGPVMLGAVVYIYGYSYAAYRSVKASGKKVQC